MSYLENKTEIDANIAYAKAFLEKRLILNSFLKKKLGGSVLNGVFKGTVLNDSDGWENSDFGSKLFGMYELEVQRFLDMLIGMPYTSIINVGAADGFYAAGLARLFPDTPIIAYEMSDALAIALRRTAEVNHVADQIQIKGECTSEALNKDCGGGVHLVLMDCEGGEEVLIPQLRPEVRAYCHFLIEIHDRTGADVGADMVGHLAATHRTLFVSQGARDPNEHASLREMTEMDRWIVVSENRGSAMRWLLALPFGHVPPPLRPVMGE